MNNQLLHFNQLKDEVEKYKIQLEKSAYFDSIKEVYKGFQILFSPLTINPEFMFIGINPGAGYFNSTGNLVNRLEPEATMEYVYENYALARETKKLFSLLGLSNDDLSKCVKTNFYYIATKNEAQLNKIIDKLDPLSYERKSNEWTKRLIEIVNPKAIICEGVSAYKKVMGMYGFSENWDGDVAYSRLGGLHIFGYKRRFSNIKDKEKLIKFLNII